MDSNELACWLALWRLQGAGPALFRKLLARFGTLAAFFAQPAAGWQALGFDSDQIAALSAFANTGVKTGAKTGDDPLGRGVQQDLDWLQQAPDHHLLSWQHPAYPPLLRQIRNAPPLLFVRGDPELLSLPQIAMVGSRHCSREGKALARQFASHFSRSGFVTTSGLALGIDTAAHQGALETGHTIAVLAHGLDTLFPPRNRELGAQIAVTGALVSEFPIGVQPRPEFFPRRNRIISGLSLGVLVVEAAIKSGSLITANEAADQGREVFAIPGSIHNPLAKGCHQLIRTGAHLVETAEQIVDELRPLLGYVCQPDLFAERPAAVPSVPASEGTTTEHQILEVLEASPIAVDQIVLLTGLAVAEINAALVLLELDGLIQQHQGGYCRA